VLIFAAFGAGILLYVAAKAFKSPTLFYASEESIDELAVRLSCPKCRSKRLRPTDLYTIGCEDCGFVFSVGTLRKRETL